MCFKTKDDKVDRSAPPKRSLALTQLRLQIKTDRNGSAGLKKSERALNFCLPRTGKTFSASWRTKGRLPNQPKAWQI